MGLTCLCRCNARSPQYAAAWAQNKAIALNVKFSTKPPRDVLGLSDYCSRHQIIDLYLWLANRFPANFVERDLALKLKVGLRHTRRTPLQLQLHQAFFCAFARHCAERSKRFASSRMVWRSW